MATQTAQDKHKATAAPFQVIRNGNTEYTVGEFLGKGGFARCFAVKSNKSGHVVACKIVSKRLLVKPYQKDKMIQEIGIHRQLSHPHVVKFFSHFEDHSNVYVLLELCKRRSLMEVVKRRGKLTYQESRYFMSQLLDGVCYLHGLKVIHRDLKLGNLFLTEHIQLKIGDFGLAAVLGNDSDRRRTLCGTPNYIAPEILEKSGHSFKVDIWSCGCILYTLLFGKPPFESDDIRETYNRIKKGTYVINAKLIPVNACQIITVMLQRNPRQRPMASALLSLPFFTESPIPSALPVSILTTEPRLEPVRSALREVQPPATEVVEERNAECGPENQLEAIKHMTALERQLCELINSNFTQTELLPMDRDAAADPASMPIYWVTKWVDYTEKYGLGYQLCDDSLAVLFNDNSRMVLLGTDQIQYIDHHNQETYHTLESFPTMLQKKVVLIKYFRQYMQQHLMTAGADALSPGALNVARLPYLQMWFRTQSAIVFLLSNGTLQLNFFKDHTKIILCPLMVAVSYIDKEKNFRTYSLKTLQNSCPKELAVRLKYTVTICAKVIERLRSP